MWKVLKGNKKDTTKTRVNSCSALVSFEQILHLVWVPLWPFFEKQVNACCDIDNILISITSHIHNAPNHAVAKNSFQSYFKNFEVLFSRKQQRAMRTDWKNMSCIFYPFFIVVKIFQLTTSFLILSITPPSLAQYRKQ